LIRAAIITPKAVSVNEQQQQPDEAQDQNRVIRNVREPREAQEDHALERRDGGTAEALADHDGPAAHGRDEDLTQEAELAIPDDGTGREDGREQHRHRQHAGIDERLEVEAAGVRQAAAGQVGQSSAEDEQEQERLHQRCDGAEPVGAEPDQLASPDDADGAQVVAKAAFGYRHPNPLDDGAGLASGHR
jgi:hypothetical protein